MFLRRQAWLRRMILVLGIGLLLIGIGKPALAGTQNETVHKVIAGESLWSIANSYGVTVQDLAFRNGIKNPNLLHIGQKLLIQKSEPAIQVSSITNQDLELLARVIYAEARGEKFEGQVAVGAVVLNRLRHPGFPKTVQGIIYQPGAFSAIADKQIKLKPDNNAWRAAETAVSGDDPTDGAIFYYNPVTATDPWIRTRPVLKVIGNHAFSS